MCVAIRYPVYRTGDASGRRGNTFVLATACVLLCIACARSEPHQPPQTKTPSHAAAPAPIPAWQSARVLRVCSDPNNLPFSNEREEGFENRLASMIASDLGARVQYTWWPQRRGFIRNTLKAGQCDVVMGIPVGFDMARATTPYYRSTYVFVTRTDRHLHIQSLDDPVLRRLKIGVHMIGDDYANPPPVHALARRGMIDNVVGYTIYGDYAKPNPPAELVYAVARGDVDVAIAWGPLAGYFAKQSPEPLTITPISPAMDTPARPFVFAIAAGSRRNDQATHDMLEQELAKRRLDIQQLLVQYGIPLVPQTVAQLSPSNSVKSAITGR